MARPASAAEPDVRACAGPHISATSALGFSWSAALASARERLARRADLDRCAEVSLAPRAGEVRVQVTLADGRAASRQLRSPDALAPTLEALLALPEAIPVVEPSSPLAPEAMPPPEDSGLAPSRARFEAGLGAMGRLASTPLIAGVGLAGFAQLSLNPWVLGVSVRWDATEQLLVDTAPSGFNMQTLGLGVVIGRRATLHQLTLDALAGPEIVAENQEAFGSDPRSDGIGGGVTDFRGALALRMVSGEGTLRWFAQSDVDASPARLWRQRRLDPGLPTLPSWSLGFSLGIAGAAP